MKRIGLMMITLAVFLSLAVGPAYADLTGEKWTGEEWKEKFSLMSSKDLTVRAWQALGAYGQTHIHSSKGNYEAAREWAQICVFFWGSYAAEQKPITGFMVETNTVNQLYTAEWAYCDVAACKFIEGESYLKHNSDNGDPIDWPSDSGDKDDAIACYCQLYPEEEQGETKNTCPGGDMESFYEFARIAKAGAGKDDPIKDKTWKVADAALARLNNDFTSGDIEAMIVDAWNHLNAGDFKEAYDEAFKVMKFRDKALAQQTDAQTAWTDKDWTVKVFFEKCWAYTHYATAYFIRAEANRRGWASGDWGDASKTDAIKYYQYLSGQDPNPPGGNWIEYGLCCEVGAVETDEIGDCTWDIHEAAAQRLLLGGEPDGAGWDAHKDLLKY